MQRHVARRNTADSRRKIALRRAPNDKWTRSARYGELHLPRVLNDLRGLKNLETDYATVIAEISNDAGANLVTFLHARVAKRDGKRVRFLVVFSLHAPASYFLNFDVL